MDVNCSNCGETWDSHHLWNGAIHDTQLSDDDKAHWLNLPPSERLTVQFRDLFRAAKWEFGLGLSNVRRCPACPLDEEPSPPASDDIESEDTCDVIILKAPRFNLGQLFATQGALRILSSAEMYAAVCRHSLGDWGDLEEEDKEENELSVQRGYRILSAYHSDAGTKFWIITEADRSVTTVLLPEEY